MDFFSLIERNSNFLAQLYRLGADVANRAFTKFVPESQPGFSYTMWDNIATIAAGGTAQANSNRFTNQTQFECHIESFKFESANALAGAILAAGGGAGSWLGVNDYNLRVKVTDLTKSQSLMPDAVPVGLLVDPQTRLWKPERPIILAPGQTGIQIEVTNVSLGAIANVWISANARMVGLATQ